MNALHIMKIAETAIAYVLRKKRNPAWWASGVFLCVFAACFCEEQIPQHGFRIVSLSPAMTEIIFALGADDNLVGVTTFCDYPAQAKEKRKVGDFSNPSIERIVAVKPNMVIINLPEQLRIKKQLDQLAMTVFTSSPTSLSDVYTEILELGRLLNKQSQAESLVRYMKTNIKHYTTEATKGVYIELSDRPLVTIGGLSYLNEILKMAGGTNIFSDLTKPYPVVSQEEIIKRDPEIIIVLHPGNIADRLGWKRITAVQNNSVYTDLDEDHLMRPGPRLVEGFQALRERIHE